MGCSVVPDIYLLPVLSCSSLFSLLPKPNNMMMMMMMMMMMVRTNYASYKWSIMNN